MIAFDDRMFVKDTVLEEVLDERTLWYHIYKQMSLLYFCDSSNNIAIIIGLNTPEVGNHDSNSPLPSSSEVLQEILYFDSEFRIRTETAFEAMTILYQKRIKKEKRTKRRLQEELEIEKKRRAQYEEALRSTSADTLRLMNAVFQTILSSTRHAVLNISIYERAIREWSRLPKNRIQQSAQQNTEQNQHRVKADENFPYFGYAISICIPLVKHLIFPSQDYVQSLQHELENRNNGRQEQDRKLQGNHLDSSFNCIACAMQVSDTKKRQLIKTFYLLQTERMSVATHLYSCRLGYKIISLSPQGYFSADDCKTNNYGYKEEEHFDSD
ncbi:hypothetical protein GQR58_001328 [Nymphon striatum]|nr:hypothetical protein GQR58_001328 [Nymphon striatum]